MIIFLKYSNLITLYYINFIFNLELLELNILFMVYICYTCHGFIGKIQVLKRHSKKPEKSRGKKMGKKAGMAGGRRRRKQRPPTPVADAGPGAKSTNRRAVFRRT
jgi:hypothetical protein